MHAFESHSQRAFFIIYDTSTTSTSTTNQPQLMEYKGLTYPYSNEIVQASGQPRGILLREHGEREAGALNAIAHSSEISGAVRAEYHDAGIAILQMREAADGMRITVTPLTDSRTDADGEIIHYGVLRRRGDDYIPFVRLDLFETLMQLARLEGVSHIELLIRAMARLGSILRTAHDIGIYHCFTHPGNIDAHGNLIDFEHAIYRTEIPALREQCQNARDKELLDDVHLRYRDIDLFFAGAREVLHRCQVCFKLSHDALMQKIRFLRENISLTVGIPVFEVLAHLNIGFYEDTLKKLPFYHQKAVIGAFVDNYCVQGAEEVKRAIFSELLSHNHQGWTPRASGLIINADTDSPVEQIPGELILKLWNLPPLKKR